MTLTRKLFIPALLALFAGSAVLGTTAAYASPDRGTHETHDRGDKGDKSQDRSSKDQKNDKGDNGGDGNSDH